VAVLEGPARGLCCYSPAAASKSGCVENLLTQACESYHAATGLRATRLGVLGQASSPTRAGEPG